MKTIILTAAAAKDFDALPRDVCEAIESALDRYAMTGEADVSKLSGRQGYRMRVGNIESYSKTT